MEKGELIVENGELKIMITINIMDIL